MSGMQPVEFDLDHVEKAAMQTFDQLQRLQVDAFDGCRVVFGHCSATRLDPRDKFAKRT
jgi:hypothetical protein